MKRRTFSGLALAGIPAALGFADSVKSWQDRESEELVRAGARELLDMVILAEDQMRASNLHTRKELVEVSKLYREERFPQALDSFCRYFTDKLRFPTKYGISPFDVNPFVRGICGSGAWPVTLDPNRGRAEVLAEADKLLNNVMVLRGKDVTIGAPGSVQWNYPYSSSHDVPLDQPLSGSLSSGSGFFALVHAYLLTHEQRYLDKWVAFMDDWSLNADFITTIHPLQVPDGAGDGTLALLRLLGGLAAVTTADRPIVPARILAQILRKRLCDFDPRAIAYMRSNTHNWTPVPAGHMMLTAMLFDEFKVAPRLMREARRRYIEDNAVTQNLRDGSENQQCPWYNVGSFREVTGALRLLAARESMPIYLEAPWIAELRNDIDWAGEVREHLKQRATYLIHLRTPQNEYPITVRGGDKRFAQTGSESDWPEAFQDPMNRSLLATIHTPAAGVRPSYTSEWFPYGGYNIVREGWEKDSACGDLFCSPKPGAYGGFRSRSNNNNFGLSAFGDDLLIDDNPASHYTYPCSPITVDGKNQFFHAGIYKVPAPAAHKVFQVSAWLDPAPWRWHASERFNLMEGVYAGPYGELSDQPVLPGTMTLDQTIRGVTHQRLVFYARAAKLWIVTDRMLSAGSHSYEQAWHLPLLPSPSAAFKPEDIVIDHENRRIMTTAAENAVGMRPAPKANLSIRQFTLASLQYTRKLTPATMRPDGRALQWGRMRIGVQCSGNGHQQIISAIVPRAPGSGLRDDIRTIKQITSGKSGVGFDAVMADGSPVRYIASPQAPEELSLGNVRIRGEALLLAGDAGVALGCTSMTVNDRQVKPGVADFEFTISGSGLGEVVPIYRPIDPVRIIPECNAFFESTEIALSSRTAGVRIHYTLDGTDPTPQSALYSRPFRINHSTTVNARAYRPGVTENPPHLSGTHATVASFGVFNKTQLLMPEGDRKPGPGLRCRYWQEEWNKLWVAIDDLKPRATGPVPQLWDFSLAPSDNPPLAEKPAPRAKHYALEYSGYLNVPADGVYTLHAPRECVWPDTDPGYELRVYLGAKLHPVTKAKIGIVEWYPSTRLHAQGNWSIGLKKGAHPFRVVYIDYRTDAPARLNKAGLRNYIWTGIAPDLKISGPGCETPQPIPAHWLTAM